MFKTIILSRCHYR